ncbi:retrovirus-related pol polyprotein from transposon tnt 1-94 [Lasius niger]|uniref:Retrovirus-related pol polyprotein from transposon tnt 1-94 n=1 Tax=Lasius niger TaxID=67767 RepID=A0A0J7MN47_LASNI|nr:retrovirus-related pol polyprotein from transposon tnt 1-94 [Lasius niger]
MALAKTAKEAAYLRTLLRELGDSGFSEITVFCDNRDAQILTENPAFHVRTKHIDIRHHYVRQAVKNGILTLKPISTTEMVADIFTKILPKSKHYICIEALGLRGI